MEHQSEVAGTTTAFAQLSARAAESANVQRLQIAKGNIRAGKNQIRLEETKARRDIARQLGTWQGHQAVSRAFRGAGGGDLGTGSAVFDAATAQAADEAAIIEANAAAKEVALIAANQPMLEDPILAAIQGGVQGLQIGTQIAQALLDEAEVKTRQGSRQLNTGPGGFPTFENTISTILEIPGLDLKDMFKDLFD